MTVDWIEVKYALVRATIACVKLAIIVTMVAWMVAKTLTGILLKGSHHE